jgi:hypothetical protein
MERLLTVHDKTSLENNSSLSLKKMPLIVWSRMWKQHDGGPPNFCRQVMEFLKDNIEGRRIGGHGPLGHPT